MEICLTDNNQIFIGTQVIDPMQALPKGTVVADEPIIPSGKYAKRVGSEWVIVDTYPIVEPTPTAIPQEVQMYQAREALIRSGIPTTQIDTIIAGLPSPQKELSQNQWEYSPTMKRYNSWVSELAPLIPLTETQLDDLFILAGTL